MKAARSTALAVGATAIGWTISTLGFVLYMGHMFADVPFEDERLTQHGRDYLGRWTDPILDR